MSRPEIALAVLLLLAAGLVVTGVALLSVPIGLMVAGVLVAALAVLFLVAVS
ncbi:hypothetical protein [Actinocrispum wychmicini]|uniref:Uncharacterized protein n=1 Tax=Actinocrispum wychmicini TaxID=1213861 RepID=A0A4V2S600_9PSEU|nr:hypothetical protein [Actinocrispum wychmicini]TCO54150.1 hypothetical protein EV192_109130 [Actinocrispum wychmicini]